MIEQTDELFGYLNQSNISKKNCERLGVLVNSPNPGIATWAALIMDVAKVKPGKRRREKFLRQRHPDLFHALCDEGLIARER